MHKLVQNTAIFFLIIFIGCNSANNTTSKDETVGTTDTLTYTIEKYRLESQVLSTEPDTLQDTTYFEARFPHFRDQEVNTYVQSLLVLNDNPDTAFSTLQETGEAFISSYEEYRKQDYSSPWAWYSNREMRVVVNKPAYISFELRHDDFTGGAHGNHGIIFGNYDLKEKREITVEDLVAPEKMDSLTLIAKDIFVKQEGVENQEDAFDNYFFEDNRFSLNNNFLLKDSSILFLYNVYEIKPYSDGTTELEIPYSNIKSILTPRAKELLGL